MEEIMRKRQREVEEAYERQVTFSKLSHQCLPVDL